MAGNAAIAIEHTKPKTLRNLPLSDDILALEYHGDDGATAEKLAQRGEERASRKIVVMLLCMFQRRLHQFQTDQFEATPLKARDDLSNQPALHGVRLEHDVAALVLVGHSHGRGGGGGRSPSRHGGQRARVEQVTPCKNCCS